PPSGPITGSWLSSSQATSWPYVPGVTAGGFGHGMIPPLELKQRWSGAANSSVPPTAVTSGSLAGELAALTQELPSQLGWAEPWSPLEAKSVMPLPVASTKTACCCCGMLGAPQASA